MRRIQLALLSLIIWALASIALLSFGNAGWVYAQTGKASSMGAPAAGSAVTPNDVNEVAKELWCPLCNGVRLDACELKACEQMRDLIAEQLAEGQDKEQIKNYFVEQYGPQVLGEPPLEGFNWLAWILPFLVLGGGGVFLWRTMQRMMVARPKGAISALQWPVPNDSMMADEYDRRLEEELSRYD